ncbi:MAG: glucose-1-phosphate thymidylyltransferase RfbA [Nitrospiraceae bacterium]|nr:glucose-1-phosphate thymidylyltransferase RfbA [Nitrospiraceae bacterium]
MKGIVLAGGNGTRLYPATLAINKHFLPVYNKPMIYYPLSVLMLSGIREILLISTPRDTGSFKSVLGDGSRLGIKIDYAVQERPGGLAEALIIGEKFINGGPVCMALGDNIFFGHGLPNVLGKAVSSIEAEGGAHVLAASVPDPERFGIIEFDAQGKALSVEEKPKKPKSNWAVTGLYFFDGQCSQIAKSIKPSARGELEITTVNAHYLEQGKLKASALGRGFAWFDAGTHDSLIEAGEFISVIENRTGLMVGCVEEIAFRNGWIGPDALAAIANSIGLNGYGKYLLSLLKA